MGKNFDVDSWLWTKSGSITTHPRRNETVKLRQKRRRSFHRPGTWWPLFFGSLRESSSLRLFSEGSNNHRGILYNTSKLLAQKTANETSEIGAQKNPFSSRQRADSHFRNFNGTNAWIRVQTFASSNLFSLFGSFWLVIIFKPQDLTRGKDIFVWCGAYRRCGWVF